MIAASLFPAHAFAETPEEMRARFRKQSAEAERRGLAEPFKGITSDGKVVDGLFPIKPTGVSTAAARAAAEQFLSSLTTEQRGKVMLPTDDPEWRKWMNQHFYQRQGISFREMTASQRNAAFTLLGASLSAKGVRLTRDIMRLNETLGELTGDREFFGEGLYFITIMGKPSASEPWGWQFDGHHGVINYFALGDQVVMTPYFAGSEPVIAASGKYQGTAILQEEQTQGLKLIQTLDDAQRQKAILNVSKTGNNALAEAFKDNLVLDYAGIRAADLPTRHQQQMLDLAGLYVGNMDEGHAKIRMDEIKRHLDATYFAWIGGTESDSVFYYRIHSPVVLIEFDHQRPFALRGSQPTREHIHTVMRTPNGNDYGNDYGKDLLRQHYLKSHSR
ncbi:MAG: DUF3500 domain-containing protein [Deltaproteobacteria bacterium]|nr:DUF3500 domain-containing protein [Deltaproteobacteria bacterium]